MIKTIFDLYLKFVTEMVKQIKANNYFQGNSFTPRPRPSWSLCGFSLKDLPKSDCF